MTCSASRALGLTWLLAEPGEVVKMHNKNEDCEERRKEETKTHTLLIQPEALLSVELICGGDPDTASNAFIYLRL